MAANSGDKFCYGIAVADIFGRSDLQTRFQSCIQTIINMLYDNQQKLYAKYKSNALNDIIENSMIFHQMTKKAYSQIL